MARGRERGAESPGEDEERGDGVANAKRKEKKRKDRKSRKLKGEKKKTGKS